MPKQSSLRSSRSSLYQRSRAAAHGDVSEISSAIPSTSHSFFSNQESVSHASCQNTAHTDLGSNTSDYQFETDNSPLTQRCNSDANDGSSDEAEVYENVSSSDSTEKLPGTNKPSLRESLCDWALHHNVMHTALNDLLKLLKPEHPSLPLDSRTLLGTPRDRCGVCKMGKGEFLYVGIRKGLLVELEHFGSDAQILSQLHLSFKFDGQCPYHNSKSQLWPILAAVEELINQVIFVGAYHGNCKPLPSSYLADFVQELKELQTDGIEFRGKTLKVILRNIVCDAPACSMIKCVKGHQGHWGCGKCFVKGGKVAGCMVFLGLDAQLRNDFNFRSKAQPEHHLHDSPLLILDIDMILYFPLDFMHLVLLGVLKRLVNVWKLGAPDPSHLQGKRKRRRRKGKLSEEMISAVDNAINLVKEFCPSDFSRVCRPLSHSGLWKATECRQFLLYFGPVVMKPFIPREMFNLFLLLHSAMRIFCSEGLCGELGRLGHEFLVKFVKESSSICGENFVSYNVHNLIHLYDCVKQYGCVEHFPAFAFEDFQRTLRGLLRGTLKPLQQIWKRMQEKKNKMKRKENRKDNEFIGSSIHESGPTCGLSGTQVKKVKALGFELSTSQWDATIILEDGTILIAQNFVWVDGEKMVVGKSFLNYKNYFQDPSSLEFT